MRSAPVASAIGLASAISPAGKRPPPATIASTLSEGAADLATPSVCGPDGVAIFDALHRRGTVTEAMLYRFDRTRCEDLRGLPLGDRKKRLASWSANGGSGSSWRHFVANVPSYAAGWNAALVKHPCGRVTGGGKFDVEAPERLRAGCAA
jgi:hypothetical protein